MIGSLLRVRKEGEEFDLQKNTNKAYWQSSMYQNADWMPGFEFYTSANVTLDPSPVFELLMLNEKDLNRDIFTVDETITLDPNWITTELSNKSNRYFCYLNDAYEFDTVYDLNKVYQLKITLSSTEVYYTEPFYQSDFDEGIPEHISITTDQSSFQTVGINLTFASGILKVDWNDGSAIENFTTGVEKTHNYGTLGIYEIKIYGDLTNITKFIADNSKITKITGLKTGLLTELKLFNNLLTGSLDLSQSPISGILHLYSNPSLTSIMFASSGNSIVTSFRVYLCDITGVLDLSNVPIGTTFEVNNNSNLTGIIFSSTGNTVVTVFYAYNSNITGVLDLSNVPVSGQFWISGNSNLTNITFASSGNGLLISLTLSSNKLTGTLDLSNLPISGNIQFPINSLLTNITFASSGNGALTNFLAYICALTNLDFSNFATSNNVPINLSSNSFTATEHDNQLINLDATGWTGGSLNIITGNTARTSASDTAYNNLIAKSWSII